MYSSWLIPPIRFSPSGFPNHAIGSHLPGSLNADTRVALIGLDALTADRLREQFYALAWDFGDLRLVDLGNLRKSSVDFAIPLFRELHLSGIVPLLVGRDDQLMRAQYLSFGDLNREVSIFNVDQHLALSPESPADDRGQALDQALHRDRPPQFHLTHAGSQRQLVDPRLEQLCLDRHYGHYPLGTARASLGELEPAIRDADLLILHIGALLRSEAPAQGGYHPSGFSLQEACQLCYYAGNSDRLSSCGMYGFDNTYADADGLRLTAAAYAQLAWYFLLGISRRCGDFPVANTGMTEYVVDTKLTERVTFWRSPRSNRWWVQVPVDQFRGEERNRLVSCSHLDYLETSKEGKLPDRILTAFARY